MGEARRKNTANKGASIFEQGLSAHRSGDVSNARSCYEKVIKKDPYHSGAAQLMGVLLSQGGNVAAAERLFRHAIAVTPDDDSAHLNYGIFLEGRGEWERSINHYQNALEVNPRSPDIAYSMSRLLVEQGYMADAEAISRSVLSHHDDYAPIRNVLAMVLTKTGRFEEADEQFKILRLVAPHNHLYRNNYGYHFVMNGMVSEGVREYTESIKLCPGANNTAHSNRLYAMNYLSTMSAEETYQEHKSYGELYKKASRRMARSVSGRRLRVGYVSPDFRQHSVAYFFEPVLKNHDRRSFEVFCYSAVRSPDETTQRIQAECEHWRDIAGLSQRAVVDQIRSDDIDVLVDLAGHTANNRLDVFAAKPAPLQITYIGYPNTTGLDAIDHRIVDGITDPLGLNDLAVEVLARIDGCFLCYGPPSFAPLPSTAPYLNNGFVTFGSFNAPEKLSDSTIALWSRVLMNVPSSRLMLKGKCFGSQMIRENFRERFARHGVEKERINVMPYLNNTEDHLGAYGKIDIALDTTPYNGTTTTCEALWMGVPVITLRGDRHASRVGASILTATGLERLIAEDEEDFIRIAGDVERVLSLRDGLRERIARSRLCDAVGFTRNYEELVMGLYQKQR